MLSKNGKKGITIISYVLLMFSVIIIVYLFAFIIFKFQITTKILSIRRDLFYIAQNSVIAFDKEKLAYGEYYINIYTMKEIIQKLIFNNYGEEVELRDVNYNCINNEITIEVDILIKPLFSIGIIKEQKIYVKEKSHIKLLEVN